MKNCICALSCKAGFRRRRAKLFFAAIAFALSLAASFAQSPSFRLAKNIDVFFAVLQELDLYYVDSINYDRMMRKGLDEMLGTLDPYTVFISESEVEDFDFSTTGQYGGIGAIIRKRDSHVEIAEPYQGFPADKGGLKAGDIILAVDGVNVDSKNVSEVSASLKGKVGTTVSLRVIKLRGKDTVDVTLERAHIQLPSVPYYAVLDGGAGYLYFSTFTKGCSEEVKHAVKELKKNGATSLILDLRGNTGGLLDEAVKVSNLFIPKNQEVVSVRGRVGGEVKYKTESKPLDVDIPMVVLINALSASSSEIVAGALQDLDRAVVVGQRSFGKGLVQSVRSLPFNQKLKITTAKYYTPSGRCVQAIDYAHRDSSGSVEKTPDSLMHEFGTRAGRTVYDGGGIMPDEVITHPTPPLILQRLFEKSMFFDFANQYYATHDTLIFTSGRFLQDSDYKEFIEFAKNSNFSYETASSQALKKLLETMKKEKYYEGLEGDLSSLSEKISPDVEKDLLLLKSDVVDVLEEEIVGRYYYQQGRMAVSISKDKEVARAKEILQNKELYGSFLQKK